MNRQQANGLWKKIALRCRQKHNERCLWGGKEGKKARGSFSFKFMHPKIFPAEIMNAL